MALSGAAAASAAEARIVGVDAARCAFTLTHPLRFGHATYAERDYVLLRVQTDVGVDGYGFALGRGTPLLEAARPAAERVLGTDPVSAISRVRGLRQANVPAHPALVRGHSLVDLGLWDLASKLAGEPLHELLGEARRDRVQALATCGYLLDVRGEDAVVAELVELRDRGFGQLKLMLSAGEPAWTHRFLSRCLEAIGSGVPLAVDFHYSFATLEQALAVCQPLDELGLAFVEDPLPPLHWRDLRALAERIETPLAAGEDVPDPSCFRDLLEGASLLRVDAGTCGGLEDAVAGIGFAAELGRPVFPHGSPWLTTQLAAVHDAVEWVEVVPTTPPNGDRIGELFRGSALAFEGSSALVGGEAGLGCELDWERVGEHAGAGWSVQFTGAMPRA